MARHIGEVGVGESRRVVEERDVARVRLSRRWIVAWAGVREVCRIARAGAGSCHVQRLPAHLLVDHLRDVPNRTLSFGHRTRCTQATFLPLQQDVHQLLP